MAKAGCGDALVPLGMANEARVPRRAHRVLPGVGRQVAVLTRKTIDLSIFQQLRERITRQLRPRFSTSPRR
jgi:hypothetical protein